MRIFISICFLLFSTFAAVVLAKQPNTSISKIRLENISPDHQQAYVEFQDELMNCAAFYNLLYQAAAKNEIHNQDLKTYSDARDNSLYLAYTVGTAIGMTEKALQAQLKMHLELLVQQLHGTWANLPALNDLGTQCKHMEEHPDHRLLYWTNYETKHNKKQPE